MVKFLIYLTTIVVSAIALSSMTAAYTIPPQSPDDAPSSGDFSILSMLPSPRRDYFEGEFLRIRISPTAHFGDARADGSYVGVGFQYPKGYEHAAVAWWGEGFTFGYTANGIQFYSTSYDSYPGHRNVLFVTDGVVRGESNGDNTKEAVYGSILRTVTEGARVELVHRFSFPRDKKFVILTVTIKNISRDALSNVRYRRIWDLDIDNTFGNDTFNVDVDQTKKKYLLYACETHCAALAASSLNPPTEWDADAWDDRDTYQPGPSVYQGPFPASGDYNVRLEWVYATLNPGETKQIVMYFIGGDNKADLDNSYSQAEARLKPPFTFRCREGSDYLPFGADTFWVDQVCPSKDKNVVSREDGPLHPNRSGPLYIVMHCTDGQDVQSAINTFQENVGSAQYIIGPNGEIVQMVSEQHTAGHVNKVHTWEGQTINNSNGIGIEMVGKCGNDKKFRYSEAIYEAAAKLVSDIILRALESNREIQPDRRHILGHEEIQDQKVAVRTDPGAQWDWDRFMRGIQGTNDIAPINQLSVELLVEKQPKRAVTVILKWKAKANGRDGFRVWRRADDGLYDPSNLSRKCNNNLTGPCVHTMSAPLRLEEGAGDWEVEKKITQKVTRPKSGTIRYCYSVWAYANRYDPHNRKDQSFQLELGYYGNYGGPLTDEKMRAREVCISISALGASGISGLAVTTITLAAQDASRSFEFVIRGQGISATSIQVLDLSGRKVFDSGEVQGNTLTWNLQNNAGQPLANGVYLYVVRVRGFNGEEYVSEVRKLVILR